MTDVDRTLEECVRYWRDTDVPAAAVDDMRHELEQHLRAAEADGRSVESVTGGDLSGFAESWASERRGVTPASMVDVAPDDGPDARARMRRTVALAGIGGVAMLVALALIPLADTGTDGNETWRWVWTIGAVVFAFAELATAGFFLLPFAIGMVAAAVLAWLDVNLLSQWLAFFGGTALAFAVVHQFLKDQDLEPEPPIGANRWVGAAAVVLEPVDGHNNTGLVRLGGEQWRATTDGPPIGADVNVTVTEVRGTRLVVEHRFDDGP